MGTRLGAVTVVTTRVVVVPPIHHGWGGRDRGRGGVGFRHGLGVGEGRGKVLGVGLQGSWGDGDAVPLLSVLGDRVLYIFGHRIIEKMFVWELCLQSLDVTSVAEQVIVQWIAAFVGFICQLNSTVLSTETEYLRTLHCLTPRYSRVCKEFTNLVQFIKAHSAGYCHQTQHVSFNNFNNWQTYPDFLQNYKNRRKKIIFYKVNLNFESNSQRNKIQSNLRIW